MHPLPWPEEEHHYGCNSYEWPPACKEAKLHCWVREHSDVGQFDAKGRKMSKRMDNCFSTSFYPRLLNLFMEMNMCKKGSQTPVMWVML
jgi:hypothetical protein